MNILKHVKKTGVLIASSLILSTLLSGPAQAQDGLSTAFLKAIREDTHAILEKINKTPDYIQLITMMALSWLDTTDESKSIAVNGSLFAMLVTARNADIQDQISQTKNTTLTFLGKTNKIANINDFAYTT